MLMSFSSIVRDIKMLDHELASYPPCKVAYCVDNGRREFTNAIFLLGSYRILRRDETAYSARAAFSWLEVIIVEAYRGATY
jgi:predicted translin family RNA/ssDNA-binding protein